MTGVSTAGGSGTTITTGASVGTAMIVVLANGAETSVGREGMGRPVPTLTGTREVSRGRTAVSRVVALVVEAATGIVTLTSNTAPGVPLTVTGTTVVETDGSSETISVALSIGMVTLTTTGSGTPVTRMGTGTTNVNASVTEEVVLGYNGLALAAMGSAVPSGVEPVPVSNGTPVLRGTIGRTAVPVPRGMGIPVPIGRPVPAGSGRAVGSP
jgi:hypothetical protein